MSSIPIVPDSDRISTVTLSASTGPVTVGFPVFGGADDLSVFLDGALIGPADWTLTSITGKNPATDILPAGDGRVTFDVPRTGQVEIVGEIKPARLSQFTPGVGIPAESQNLVLSKLWAALREGYSWSKAALKLPVGERAVCLPSSSERKGKVLYFDNITGAPTLASPFVGGIAATTTVLNDSELPGGPTLAELLSQIGVDLHVRQFGAASDGDEDDTDAIIAAIQELGNSPGVLRFGRRHKISAKLPSPNSNQLFLGVGGDFLHDTGSQDQQVQTLLSWYGAPGETMMEFYSPAGAAAQKKWGGGAKGISFDGRGIAGRGIQITSRNGFLFKDLFFREFTDASLHMDVVDTLGESRDNQHFTLSGLTFSNAITSGKAIVFTGDNAANTSRVYRISDLVVRYKNGVGIDFENVDTMEMVGVVFQRLSGGTALPYIFRGADSATPSSYARAVTMRRVSDTVGGLAEGTASRDIGSRFNAVLGLNIENGSVKPTIEAGAQCRYSYEHGLESESKALMAGFSDTAGSFVPGGIYETLRAAYAQASLIVIGNSSSDIILSRGDGAHRWRIYQGADGVLTFGKLTGSGSTVKAPTFEATTAVVLPGNPSSALHAAPKQYVDQIVAAQDAMVFKGVIDCSANPNFPAADRGWTYRISVAGKIGGASGINVEVGDVVLCLTDGTASGDQVTVGANWSVIQANLDGAVIGPASATNNHFVQFDGATGKLIKGGISFDTDGALGAASNTRVPSQAAVKAYADTKYTPGGSDVAVVDGGTGASTAREAAANLKVPYLLAASAVKVDHTGNTNETALATITVPAGVMGLNGFLEIDCRWSYTNNANNKTIRARAGGISGTLLWVAVQTTQLSTRILIDFRNRGAANSQVSGQAGTGSGAGNGTTVSSSIDTTVAFDIVLSGQLANSADLVSIESYSVKLSVP